jgi:hypothetical protein
MQVASVAEADEMIFHQAPGTVLFWNSATVPGSVFFRYQTLQRICCKSNVYQSKGSQACG